MSDAGEALQQIVDLEVPRSSRGGGTIANDKIQLVRRSVDGRTRRRGRGFAVAAILKVVEAHAG